MKHLLKLLLIAAVLFPLGMTAQNAVTAVDGNLPQLTDESSAAVQGKSMLYALKGDPSLSDPRRVIVSPPVGAQSETWTINTTFQRPPQNWWEYNWTSTNFYTNNVSVIVFGEDIYIQGLSYRVRDAWIRGTIDGTTVTFSDQMQLGSYNGNMVWFFGRTSDDWTDNGIEFTYDPAQKSLTLKNGIYIVESYVTESDEPGVINVNFQYRHSGTRIRGSVEANRLLPVSGRRYNNNTPQHSQMVFPESKMVFYKNTKLNSITFYTRDGVKFSGGAVNISLAVVDQNGFAANNSAPISATLTQVASVVPSVSTTSAWTIEFNEPFEYQGGNLLIDLVTSPGTNGDTYFYLEGTSNFASYYSSQENNYGNTCINYLPVVQFGFERLYEERDVTVLTPEQIAGISYTWPIVDSNDMTANSQTSKLDDIAYNPDQIIAMLKEIYTNKDIPGNMRRGFSSTAGRDHDDEVPYTAVGTLSRTGTGNNATTVFNDAYGWQFEDSEVIKKSGNSGNYQYWYMDPDQYRPMKDGKPYEGLTVVLLEMKDDFSPTSITDGDDHLDQIVFENTGGYAKLRECVDKTIKSARVISEAKRSGIGMGAGTLFKIDCDKMNKFYFIAKGQLQWHAVSSDVVAQTFYDNPCYIGSGVNKYVDEGIDAGDSHSHPFLCHMFEQFSPALGNADVTKDDIYQEFTKNMQSFGVDHDCPNVPYIRNGHHFMMYDYFSQSADCQDVRDMMFFVPDYRMLYHKDRSGGGSQDYFSYNPLIQPTLGMFVIKQNEIPEGNIISSDEDTMTGIYKHQLSWKSNLDDFLPGEMQEYQLWEVVVDEFGVESYQQVYYRNQNGEYTDAEGNVVGEANKVPIVLDRQNLNSFNYDNVYVDMMAGSQIKTYVIRGRDKEGFLSLQMSNPEEVVIPGLDPREKTRMIGATYYSRYNPTNEKNCYSNKIELSNNGMTLTAADVANRDINFYRSSRAAVVDANGDLVLDANGNIQYAAEADKVLVATATANGSAITVTLNEVANVSSEFPVGKSDGNVAGYHANGTLSFPYTIQDGVINLTNGFRFWDNFTVEVDKNAHPLQYIYKMEIGTPEDGDAYAYSNDVRVPVFKTDSKINGSFTKDEVDNDGYQLVDGALVSTNVPSVAVSDDIEFDEKVQLASKSDLLRYDAYRWNAADETYYIVNEVDGEDEGDLPPDGIAGNQSEYYTVTMNDDDDPDNYYVAPSSAQPQVSTANPTAWAKFVDYYPKNNKVAIDYLYAPVVELYSRGYLEQPDAQGNRVPRIDYNTYGGPQQNAATGKFKFIDEDNIEFSMSDYSWPGARNLPQYCYYNVFLNFSSAEIPAGYKLYMVRAWRQAPADMLGEQTPNESDATADYRYRTGTSIGAGKIDGVTYDDMNSFMFDEIKYDNSEYCVISTTNQIAQGAKDITQYKFGDQPVSTTIINGVEVPNVWNYTFGARRVSGFDGEEGWNTVDEVPLKFIVRAYFTKTGNIGSKADGDGKFYITEKTIDYKITGSGNIVTAVSDVKINKQVVGVTYYNMTGMSSNEPFDGINIVVTHYNDGTTSTTKVLK